MEKGNIYKKLLEAKKEIGTVAKNAKNPHFKNTYADINALIEAVEPILLEHGLVLLQPIREGRQFTEIHDTETGEKVESYLDLNPTLPPQAQGSAITYFRRYTLQSLLSLKADDDDGQRASVPQPKPMFTTEMFEKAHKANASVDKIKGSYTVTAEVERAYNLFIQANK
jgi:hypothetical protein